MNAVMDTLGQRILRAARMAVALHLNQVTTASSLRGQRVTIGSSGPQVGGSGDRTILASDDDLPAGDRFEDLENPASPSTSEGAD